MNDQHVDLSWQIPYMIIEISTFSQGKGLGFMFHLVNRMLSFQDTHTISVIYSHVINSFVHQILNATNTCEVYHVIKF